MGKRFDAILSVGHTLILNAIDVYESRTHLQNNHLADNFPQNLNNTTKKGKIKLKEPGSCSYVRVYVYCSLIYVC